MGKKVAFAVAIALLFVLLAPLEPVLAAETSEDASALDSGGLFTPLLSILSIGTLVGMAYLMIADRG
ncbi:hypothetical protein [Shouchella shacheensis]|uniref:hypothetical protein n=1 Tax=Shouchella shacheensis TaxID=1649580 RepID=UPI00074030FA|nr:hypothetical protein [Shouchella shacheensis]